MHELSIAEGILAVARDHANGRRVTRVELRIGHLRQVVASALEFAFQLLSAGTRFEGAELVIEDVPVRGLCRACGAETEMRDFPLRCGGCGRIDDIEIVAGEELLVDAIELEEDQELTTEGMAHGC